MGGVLHLPGRVIHDSHAGLAFYPCVRYWKNQQHWRHTDSVRVWAAKTCTNTFGASASARRPGLRLPAESGGKLRRLERWGTTSLASIVMGQEVSTTSIQLARACSASSPMAVCWCKPKLILKEGGHPTPVDPPGAFSGSNRHHDAPDDGRRSAHGTGRARIAGYTTGGKTGTAQIFDVKAHRYTHQYNASFMGFAPVTNPALVIVVTLNGTSGSTGMGAGAAASGVQGRRHRDAARSGRAP